jgi:hypothetical protein
MSDDRPRPPDLPVFGSSPAQATLADAIMLRGAVINLAQAIKRCTGSADVHRDMDELVKMLTGDNDG